MTAVSSTSDVQLICDGCGATAPVRGGGFHDGEAVYVGAAAIGWSGSPFARGEHRCPDCAALATSRLRMTTTEPAAVIRVDGDVDIDIVDDLRAMLDEAVTLRPYVIVDLTSVAGIDSLGFGTLARARATARRNGGDVFLAGLSPFTRTVLQTMRLHTVFPTFETVPQAITATGLAVPGERS